MIDWIQNYIESQRQLLAGIDPEEVAGLIGILSEAWRENRQVFLFGNGGSASNCSHFATDLGKSSSDALGKRFKVMTLNDNVSWITALGNDYSYEDIYVGQLQNYGEPGDVALSLSVSGASPNCVKALTWAKDNGLKTISLVGGKRGPMADISDHSIVLKDEHYGRVEDAQMTICHLLCYVFLEVQGAAEKTS